MCCYLIHTSQCSWAQLKGKPRVYIMPLTTRAYEGSKLCSLPRALLCHSLLVTTREETLKSWESWLMQQPETIQTGFHTCSQSLKWFEKDGRICQCGCSTFGKRVIKVHPSETWFKFYLFLLLGLQLLATSSLYFKQCQQDTSHFLQVSDLGI